MKLSIIGSGNMGGAIARGLKNSNIIKSSDIYCADVSREVLNNIKAFNAEINITTDSIKAVKNADIIIVAVKPWLLETVINEIKETMDYERQIFVSLAAGINFSNIYGFLKNENGDTPAIFRVVPNTAIEVKESANFISPYNASDKQIEIVKNIFDELGLTFIIEERLIGAATSLSSCGIAFAFRYIRAAIEGAVEIGLNAELAKKIELQTLRGAIELLEKNNNHPEAEIDKVTTPGGITIKGLNAMEEAGFTNAVIKGLKASLS